MKTHYGIIGFGLVGRVIGAHLAQAGHKVSVFYRNPELANAMRSGPLKVSGKLSASANITDLYLDMQEFLDASPDVILLSTKVFDAPDILKSIKALNYPENIKILSCQNGLGIENTIKEIFGVGHALIMAVNMGCGWVTENHVKVKFSSTNFLSVNPDISADVTDKIAEDLVASGLTVEIREDYRTEVFKKAILNSSAGYLCALTRHTMSSVMGQEYLQLMAAQIVEEGIRIAQAMDIPIEDEFLNTAMAYLEGAGSHKPSLLVDIEEGRITENEYICGELTRYAEEYNVKVTLIPIIYNLIKSIESPE